MVTLARCAVVAASLQTPGFVLMDKYSGLLRSGIPWSGHIVSLRRDSAGGHGMTAETPGRPPRVSAIDTCIMAAAILKWRAGVLQSLTLIYSSRTKPRCIRWSEDTKVCRSCIQIQGCSRTERLAWQVTPKKVYN